MNQKAKAEGALSERESLSPPYPEAMTDSSSDARADEVEEEDCLCPEVLLKEPTIYEWH